MALKGVSSVCDFHSMLLSLNTLPEIFYLTGSRYFGTERPDSDWDFFSKYSPGLRDRLISLGFEEVYSSSEKKYSNAVSILYYHNLNSYTNSIHIQLVEDVETRLALHDVFKTIPLSKRRDLFSNKVLSRVAWTVATASYLKGKETSCHNYDIDGSEISGDSTISTLKGLADKTNVSELIEDPSNPDINYNARGILLLAMELVKRHT